MQTGPVHFESVTANELLLDQGGGSASGAITDLELAIGGNVEIDLTGTAASLSVTGHSGSATIDGLSVASADVSLHGLAMADVNVSGTVTGTAELHYMLGAVTVQIATEGNAVVSELP